MNYNPLHHYVPQFYLKRFVDDNGQVWVYDKDTDRVFSSTPRNVAAEHGFYSLPVPFPDPSLLERQFSELEDEAALITEDWLNHLEPGCSIEIPDVNREIMSLYITTQLLRTSESRTLMLQSIADSEISEIMSSEGEIQRALHIELLWNDKIVKEISDWIHNCNWIFRVNMMPESLYTSDDPFKVRSKTEHLHWRQTTIDGAYLLMPLTSRVLMYCFDSQYWNALKVLDRRVIPIPLEPELVKDANTHQVGHARRFVFSDQDDFSLAREFCSQYPGAVGQDRKRFDH